jgi:hypothetical protein
MIAVGSVAFLVFSHPKEWFVAVDTFLNEAGVLCVVFGLIEHYIEAAKTPGRLGWSWRNIDVVVVGVIAIAAGVAISAQGN